ncbi:MAG: hypothetical protein LBQ93_06895 [Treponema sp.]|jgi:hypothetical protein|nr:hypothetical protein [Treponema sp.]
MSEFITDFISSSWIVPIIIFSIILLSNAYFGYWLAGKKGYSQIAWFCLCFFFGIGALLTLGFAPLNNNKKPVKTAYTD